MYVHHMFLPREHEGAPICLGEPNSWIFLGSMKAMILFERPLTSGHAFLSLNVQDVAQEVLPDCFVECSSFVQLRQAKSLSTLLESAFRQAAMWNVDGAPGTLIHPEAERLARMQQDRQLQLARQLEMGIAPHVPVVTEEDRIHMCLMGGKPDLEREFAHHPHVLAQQ